jgi:uncharacterized protein YjiS (DUF1127 family)
MAYVNTAQGTDGGILQRLAKTYRTFQDYRARRAVYRQTVNELRTLSDRDLADLGLHASMIQQVAREAAFGK